MDTRNKIIPLEEAAALLADHLWIAAAGAFDPMTATEAARLAELGKDRKLLVAVLEEQNALLDASARAALVAALRDVSAVTIASPEAWQAAMNDGPAMNVIHDPSGDTARRKAFIEMVLSKQRSQ